MRFHISLVNSVCNTSGTRLVGGKLDLVIAPPSQTQSFSIIQTTPTPHLEKKSEGNTHALTRIPVLDAERSFESRIDIEYSTSAMSFGPEKVSVQADEVNSTDEFCRRDKFWETKDPLIRRTAERIQRSSAEAGGFLSNAFAWVRDNVKLREPQQTRHGAASAIRELTGDCDEFSDLFIALCRTAGIPCRRVVGLFYSGDLAAGRSFEWHAWAEVRAAHDVWIPFDPSLGFFASISERHIARCCMGRRSDYPIRGLTWRSIPVRAPTLNDDDVESLTVVSK